MTLRFGRYVIKDDKRDELGRGAFGTVYRAFDPNVNRQVAVKVLSSQSDPEMVSRFREESKTAGKLEHQHIVKVYDAELQDGVPYLVMELLEGETLEAIIRNRLLFGKPIELLDKVEIMFQVAQGLQYAHSKKVIHRDIKPSNIMVLPDGTAKVMDFGIARVTDPNGSRSSQQGELAGTILYMAPEQFKYGTADRRSDIFAYGDVYYEMLTGEQPFYAKDPASVLYRITTYEPPALRLKVADCPEALEALVQRLMAKDRELRPDRLEEVILDTQPILQQLRQARAASIAARIPGLVEAGEEEEAQAAVREVLGLDPLNAEARQWRQELQRANMKKSLRQRAESLLRQAHGLMAARQFGEAVQCLESAYKLDRDHGEIRAVFCQARCRQDAAKRAIRVLSEARLEAESNEVLIGRAKAMRAIQLDPGNSEAAEFCKELNRRLLGHRAAACLAEADALRKAEEYDQALSVLEEFPSDLTLQPGLEDVRKRIEQDRLAGEKRREYTWFQLKLAKARDALLAERIPEAAESAEKLSIEYPDQAAAADFRLEVREYLAAQKRREAVGSTIRQSRAWIASELYADARDLLEKGLRFYPSDRDMRALLESAAEFAASQQREQKIQDALERAHSLQQSGRLEEAVGLIDTTVAETGQESRLLARKRRLQFDMAEREYRSSVSIEVEKARKLLEDEEPFQAVTALEDAGFRFPGEPEIGELLSAARVAAASAAEIEFVGQATARISTLQKRGQLRAALEMCEAASARYPDNDALRNEVHRIQALAAETGQQAILDRHLRRIEEAIQTEEWAEASQRLGKAEQNFPGEQRLNELAARIEAEKRKAELELMTERVRIAFAGQDFEAAGRLLGESQSAFSEEPAWRGLWDELERSREYENLLGAAEEARTRAEYDRAAALLQPAVTEATDDRASELLNVVAEEKKLAEQRAHREAEHQARREAAEKARLERQEIIRKAREEAAELVLRQDLQSAIEILNRLRREYPDNPDVQRELHATIQLDRRRRDEESQRNIEEAARKKRGQAVATARNEAAELMEKGDLDAAIAVLKRIDLEYPDDPDVQRERDAAVRLQREREERRRRDAEAAALREQEIAAAKARREAEEAARRERLKVISDGRSQASALAKSGDFRSAMVVLDHLLDRFPGDLELVQERESVIQMEQERQQAERRAREALANVSAKRRVQEALPRVDGRPAAVEKTGHDPLLSAEDRAKQALATHARRRQSAGDAWSVNPQALGFAVEKGTRPPRPQRIAVSGTSRYRVQTSAAWLRAEATDGSVEVSIDPTGLPTGHYSGIVAVTDTTGFERQVSVRLTIL